MDTKDFKLVKNDAKPISFKEFAEGIIHSSPELIKEALENREERIKELEAKIQMLSERYIEPLNDTVRGEADTIDKLKAENLKLIDRVKELEAELKERYKVIKVLEVMFNVEQDSFNGAMNQGATLINEVKKLKADLSQERVTSALLKSENKAINERNLQMNKEKESAIFKASMLSAENKELKKAVKFWKNQSQLNALNISKGRVVTK